MVHSSQEPGPPPARRRKEDGGAKSLLERLEPHLHEVRAPAQYAGGEWNSVVKPFDSTALRVALAFPDTYAMGMSSLGMQLIYHLFNRRDDALAERFFAPEPDMEALLRREGIPLASLESHRPMGAFDLAAFSLQYELLLTNVLSMLDLSDLPLLARDRGEGVPLVVAGGGGVSAPEVSAPFFDLLLVGDGEAIVDPLVDSLKNHLAEGRPRSEIVRALAEEVPGAYAPSLYRRRRSPSGFMIPEPLEGAGAPKRILPAFVEDLDAAPLAVRPVVPSVEVPHDRISIEIMRGCPHRCRFCEAGFTRKPVRIRRAETVLAAAESLLDATGYEEISLLSLSAGDYPGLSDLLREAHDRFADRSVSISLPSLRVDGRTAELPQLISTVRKSGLTLAPEAGARLRGFVNKDIRDEDLFAAATRAWEEGWRLIKLYFMIGFPGETGEDLEAIASLADGVAKLRGRVGPSAGHVNVTISPFVPRPHTPFQWDAQASPEDHRRAFDRILAARRIKSVRYKLHSPERAVLEGILARGDELVARAVLEAYRMGARFDAWDDRFDPRIWDEALARIGVDPSRYLRKPRSVAEETPWDIVRIGGGRAVLAKEREKASSGELSPACGVERCAGICGPRITACLWEAP